MIDLMSRNNLRKRTQGSLSSPEEQPTSRANPAEIKEAKRFHAMCEVFEDPGLYQCQSEEHKRDTVCC